jgi:hypothetical protein
MPAAPQASTVPKLISRSDRQCGQQENALLSHGRRGKVNGDLLEPGTKRGVERCGTSADGGAGGAEQEDVGNYRLVP